MWKSFFRTCKRDGFTLVELLVVIAIIGVLVALLLPAVQAARESARRTSCTNNLRQVGLAVLNYADQNGSLPAGYVYEQSDDNTQGNNGVVVNGFFALILPFVEQKVLQDTYDFEQGYDHVTNQPAVNTPVSIYQCPSTPGDRTMEIVNDFSLFNSRQGHTGQATDYFGISEVQDGVPPPNGPNRKDGVFIAVFPSFLGGEPKKPLRFAQITDGLSKTIMLVEMAGRPERYIAGEPKGSHEYYAGTWAGVNGERLHTLAAKPVDNGDYGDCFINCHNYYTAYSFHPGGVNMMLCDGSVHFLNEDIEFDLWWNLAQPDDGQVL
ncbi:MAG TPA: prepilin-type cleavage/methylation domain-containing protein, partial [Planctomycetaceae bacterium]|nr:prepilin-type cleavage/methylation domain-containing protein [Planctomycetaceae bacterium]